jgi:hypothetical protein
MHIIIFVVMHCYQKSNQVYHLLLFPLVSVLSTVVELWCGVSFFCSGGKRDGTGVSK